MGDVVIIYASAEGQTRRIAEQMAAIARDAGHKAQVVNFRDLRGGSAPAADAIIIGASVHVGHHPEELEAWVRTHLGELENLRSAFFSVSLSARGARPGAQEEAREYVSDFLRRTGWHPGRAASFAGALRYTRYGFFKRMLMKVITARSGSSDVDTHRDYEYTDWAAVESFVRESLADIR